MNQTQFVLLTIAAVITVIIIATVVGRSIKKQRMMLFLKTLWGAKDPGKNRTFIAENRKATLLAKKDSYPFFIDDITWDDLNMDTIFCRMNYTRSTVGEEYLYALLRLPVFDRHQLEEREKIISLFQQDEALRLKYQYLLSGLGFSHEIRLADWLYGKPGVFSTSIVPYVALVVLLFLSPLLFIFEPSIGLSAVVLIVLTNMLVHANGVKKLSVYLEPVKYLVRMISAGRKISKIQNEVLSPEQKRLAELSKIMNTFSVQNFTYMQTISQDPFTEYIKTIFLGEIIFFKRTMKELLKHQAELQEIYDILGRIDSFISIASYRSSVNNWCRPVFSQDKTKSFSITDAWHPLIENPISNSMSMNASVLLTGSNASGKSTWLKVCAINVLLAQTIHTCTATAYDSSFLKLYSSMALRDDITSGESYYIVEIRSLKRILDAAAGEQPIFCVIDEVLRGTNTIERIAASSEVLLSLASGNCLCVAATHDLELVQLLEPVYTPYHFQEKITDEAIAFDYILYPGSTKTRNAIKLLSLMGYPPSIVKRAEERSEAFIQTGVWERHISHQ